MPQLDRPPTEYEEDLESDLDQVAQVLLEKHTVDECQSLYGSDVTSVLVEALERRNDPRRYTPWHARGDSDLLYFLQAAHSDGLLHRRREARKLIERALQHYTHGSPYGDAGMSVAIPYCLEPASAPRPISPAEKTAYEEIRIMIPPHLRKSDAEFLLELQVFEQMGLS